MVGDTDTSDDESINYLIASDLFHGLQQTERAARVDFLGNLVKIQALASITFSPEVHDFLLLMSVGS